MCVPYLALCTLARVCSCVLGMVSVCACARVCECEMVFAGVIAGVIAGVRVTSHIAWPSNCIDLTKIRLLHYQVIRKLPPRIAQEHVVSVPCFGS